MTPARFWSAVALFHGALLVLALCLARRWRSPERCRRPLVPWVRALLRDGSRLLVVAVLLALLLPLLAVLPDIERTSKSSAAGLLLGEATFCEGLLLLTWMAWCHWRAGVRARAGALGVASLALGIAAWEGYYRGPRALVVRRHVVDRAYDGEPTRRLRILHLTDIQTPAIGAHEERALSAGLAERRDLIVMTGDYVQDRLGRSTEARAAADLRALMSRLAFTAPLGVFATEGDTGPPCREVFAGTWVTCLVDASVTVPLPAGGTLGLTGLSRARGRERTSAWLEGRLRAAPPADHRLVISHAPDFVDALAVPRPDLDLVLAGHTHGGQVVVPLLGPPFTASRLPRRYAGGLHDFRGIPLHVSRGVGMERGFAPQVRFLCPPEVCVLDVRLPGPAYRAASLASRRSLRSTPQR